MGNLHFINLSVRFYDQTDVVPIFSAAMLVAEMSSGLIVGGETSLYNAKELTGIFLSCLVCIAGISVLVLKKSQLNLEVRPEDN